MQPSDLITFLLNKFVPASAVRSEARPDGLYYLHATKGWRRIAWRRIGIIPSEVS